MGNPFQFYKDEKMDHKVALAQYAGSVAYASGYDKLAEGANQFKNMQWMNDNCDNINLQEDNRGGWCNYCQHYHWRNVAARQIQKAVLLMPGRYDLPDRPGVWIEPVWLPPVEIPSHIEACWWDPYEGKDCSMDLERGFLNPGKYQSDWTEFDWGLTGGDDELPVPRKSKKQKDNRNVRKSLQEKYPDIYSND